MTLKYLDSLERFCCSRSFTLRFSSSVIFLRSQAPRLISTRVSYSKLSFTSWSKRESVVKLGEWLTYTQVGESQNTNAYMHIRIQTKKKHRPGECSAMARARTNYSYLLYQLSLSIESPPPIARASAGSPARHQSPGSQSRHCPLYGWGSRCGSCVWVLDELRWGS